ncbi:MAG: hypothetical protein OXC27_22590 [Caldilineaceae bacterium]|nr:hypothetical protein [Caldilineaceae bacterium]
MNGRKRFRWASIVILTLLLTVALAPAAAAQDPPPVDDPTNNNGGAGQNTGANNPPPTGGTQNPPPTNGNGGSQNPPPTNGNGGNGNNGGGGMMAPSWPPSNMIVTHAATQVQLAPVNGGLQVYFIAPGGVGHSGPWIDTFASLATQYPTGGAMTLYTGTNPGTGKPVTIYYLASEKKVRVSTYYPDTQYDVNKPYVFTVDSGHNVVHDQW